MVFNGFRYQAKRAVVGSAYAPEFSMAPQSSIPVWGRPKGPPTFLVERFVFLLVSFPERWAALVSQ
jgi:hypothetical protein